MRDSVEIEIGDDLYEIEVSHFEPPVHYRWNEPPEGGEIDLGPRVVIHIPDPRGSTVRITCSMEYGAFLKIWEAHLRLDPDTCRRKLEDKCFMLMMQQLEDRYED